MQNTALETLLVSRREETLDSGTHFMLLQIKGLALYTFDELLLCYYSGEVVETV